MSNIHVPGADLLTTVAIYADGVWAGSGKLRKAEVGYVIEDCPAVLSDNVYEAIEASIDDSVEAMRAQQDGEVTVADVTYSWEAR